MGEWYYPNTSMVRIEGTGDSFYRNRGPSVVRLHRRYDAMMPTGLFYCEVPDTNEVIQRIYIMIEILEGNVNHRYGRGVYSLCYRIIRSVLKYFIVIVANDRTRKVKTHNS